MTWWKPWTWNRIVASVESSEFTTHDVDLTLALAAIEADTDPISGLDMDVVTDPANQFKFVTKRPLTNWAARTLDADQDAFYKPLDDARAALHPPLPPISRAGHLWRVFLNDEPNPEPE